MSSRNTGRCDRCGRRLGSNRLVHTPDGTRCRACLDRDARDAEPQPSRGADPGPTWRPTPAPIHQWRAGQLARATTDIRAFLLEVETTDHQARAGERRCA